VWDKICAAKSAENPMFKRVLDSQKEFAERACRYGFDYQVDFRMAYNRYFGRPAGQPAKGAAKKA
jgi:TRAP-type mannitol/chloroaromatic compound transport system substrate-binding protein